MVKKATRRKKTSGRKRSAASRPGGMMHWYLLGAAVVAGVVYMDGRAAGPETPASAIRTASIERTEKKREREAVSVRPKPRPVVAVEQKLPVPEALPAFSGKWFICTTQTDYCVLDGGTILYAGRKVRLADIDAPAIAEARCEAERARGGDAKLRLREILNEGGVTLSSAKERPAERAGATARLVLRNGQSIGHRLVKEGLARPWTGRHQSWCG